MKQAINCVVQTFVSLYRIAIEIMLGFKTSKKVKLRKTKKELVEKTFQLCIKKNNDSSKSKFETSKTVFCVVFFLINFLWSMYWNKECFFNVVKN